MADLEKRIKEIVAVSGDWFQIQVEHSVEDNSDRLVMSRVIAWAVVSYGPTHHEELFQGIDSNGLGPSEELQYVYVHGDDLAPDGRAWRVVFNETPGFNLGLKDISGMSESETPSPSRSSSAVVKFR